MKIIDSNKYDIIYTEKAVLIDVFRATTSIVVILSNGAEKIIPFPNEESAREFYKKNRDMILVGERNGYKIPDFHFGNTPYLLSKHDFHGKSVIFVSTNGTRVLNKIKSNHIYFASFLNASSILKVLDEKTDFICANRLNLLSIEDFMLAAYLKAKKLNIKIDYNRIKDIILKSKSADRVRSLNAEEDIYFSLNLDLYDIIPYYFNGEIKALK
ncbi:MAG: 2-phosphosulfolactate phosphatase [Thermoplasmata archaeon]